MASVATRQTPKSGGDNHACSHCGWKLPGCRLGVAIECPPLHDFLDLESLAGMTYWNLVRSAALSVAFALLLNGCGGGDKSLAETSDVAVSSIAQGTILNFG